MWRIVFTKPALKDAKVQALALKVIADRLEHGVAIPKIPKLFSVAVAS